MRKSTCTPWARSSILLPIALFLSATSAAGHASTIVVDDLSDGGPGNCLSSCSLRDAISSAASGDTIEFASSLSFPAAITLAGQELLVYKNVTIIGPGQNLLAIDGNQQSRIFEIAANGDGHHQRCRIEQWSCRRRRRRLHEQFGSARRRKRLWRSRARQRRFLIAIDQLPIERQSSNRRKGRYDQRSRRYARKWGAPLTVAQYSVRAR